MYTNYKEAIAYIVEKLDLVKKLNKDKNLNYNEDLRNKLKKMGFPVIASEKK